MQKEDEEIMDKNKPLTHEVFYSFFYFIFINVKKGCN